MKIIIETIPHEQQRYPTVGDWFYEPDEQGGGTLRIKVSDLGDWRFNVLVAVHELVEAQLCEQAGVTQQAVDEFDKNFETEREAGKHAAADEPGDDKSAPYRKQHGIATGVERIMAAELGVDWNEYANAVESL